MKLLLIETKNFLQIIFLNSIHLYLINRYENPRASESANRRFHKGLALAALDLTTSTPLMMITWSATAFRVDSDANFAKHKFENQY